MPSSYPTQLDSDLELPRSDRNVTEIDGSTINAIRDAVIAIERAVGVSPQGNRNSLVERINAVIDADGNLKSAAVSSVGLISLPINNSHIGDNAAIEEDKIDLDYSTSYLQGRISSAVTDISTINTALLGFISDTFKHYNGTLNRHDGYQIDLSTNIRGQDDVESALHQTSNDLLDHTGGYQVAHHASDISVTDVFTNISATNTQSALEQLDALDPGVTTHQDLLHDTAIALNTSGEQGTQGNLANTTFASTIFETDTGVATNILQVMRPNVARVSGTTPDLQALAIGSKDALRIQAGGVGLGTLDVDLSSALPTDNLNDIVSRINVVAATASNHYPISAYNVNGRLVIAHNMNGAEFTIRVLSTISQSAHAELGFGDVTATTFSWAESKHSALVGDTRIVDMRPLVRTTYVHSSGALDEIYPGYGDLLTVFGVSTDNEARLICNITNHSVSDSANGTYYIQSILGAGNTGFQLNTTIAYGTFDIEIVADAVNFDTAANGQIYDVFLEPETADGYDGYGSVIKELRAEYLTISGISIRSLNKTFPTSSVQWKVTSGDTLNIIVGGEYGTSVTIPSTYRGALFAFAPDNINSAMFEVTGNVSGTTTRAVTVNDFDGADNKLYLSSVHYAGDFGGTDLRFVTDKRVFGTGGKTKVFDILNPPEIEDVLSELRSNGVIRGFEYLSNTSTTIRVKGGRALINGKIVDVETKNVTVDDFTGGSRLLMLDENGLYRFFNSDEAGYSMDEITAEDAYGDTRRLVPVLEFGTTGSALSNNTFLDKRLMISNIDKRLVDAKSELNSNIEQLESALSGSLWGELVTTTQDAPGETVAQITTSANAFFQAIDESGFSGVETTRRFEFVDGYTWKHNLFKPIGMTHINLYFQVIYSDSSGSDPFGVSGLVELYFGCRATTGISNDTDEDEYVLFKTIDTTVMPADSVSEQYVVSIPLSQFSNISDNGIFDIHTRVKIVGSTYIDGGSGGGSSPTLSFGKLRLITSSYSVAGNILNTSGGSTALAASVGDIL